jgi:hypothetical protein
MYEQIIAVVFVQLKKINTAGGEGGGGQRTFENFNRSLIPLLHFDAVKSN